MEDQSGFREFVRDRGPALTRAAYVLTGDRHLAEDLLQEVLVKVVRHWDRIRRVGAVEPYVRSALYREYVSWRRLRRNAEVPSGELPDRPRNGDHTDGTALRLTLERALAVLTRKQRAVIVLRYYEDLSEADTAKVLGCSVGTVKRQTHDGLRRLRRSAPELGAVLDHAEPDQLAAAGRRSALRPPGGGRDR